jgi:salicylate hydroxylase
VATSRTIIIAGAGIGGLTAALALAQRGFRIILVDQTARLEETGAGIQLSPNATRVLCDLGLEARLKTRAIAPEAVEVASGAGARLARIPLGETVVKRHGAPYWAIHRGDLQTVLAEAAHGHPDITIKLGSRLEDFVLHPNGISVACRRGADAADERGIALVGADGLWSTLRPRLGHEQTPVFRERTAWRALIPAAEVEPDFRRNVVRLWLGPDAHLVHYPVKAGTLINVIAIVGDRWAEPGWSAAGEREDLLAGFPRERWAAAPRSLVERPQHWLKWALYDLAPLKRLRGRHAAQPVTLLGDAAHPMLPFLAQGAAMAIEDAAVLAACLARAGDDLAAGMRRYEAARRSRTRKVQRAARRNGAVYHHAGAKAAMRNLYMRAVGGQGLLRRYDWLYGWRPAPPA